MDKETDELIAEFVGEHGLANLENWRPTYNIRPTDPVPVVIESARDGEVTRRLESARWSLVPSFSKELKTKYPTFNARAEEAASKASFAPSVRSRRAIIPATGYYEWQTIGKTKTPYFIRLPGDIMGLAGLYSWWADPALARDDPERWHLTATILTSDAVHTLEHIHDRNPVPLPRELWDHWLDPTVVGDQALLDEAVRAAVTVASSLEFYEVGPVVDEGPHLIEPR